MPDATLQDNRRRIARLLQKVQARDEVIAGLAGQKLNLLQLYREQHNEVLRLRAALRRNGSDMSAVPTPYQPATDFSDYAASNPSYALPGTQMDVELNAIDTLTSAMLARAAEIQRDDGQIRNGIIGIDQLSASAVRGLSTPTAWLTGTAYLVGNLVVQSGNLYLCAVAHTSGTFATDLAAVKWTLLGALSIPAGTVIQQTFTSLASPNSLTTIMPYGAAGPVKTEGDEVLTASITPLFDSSYIRATFQAECLWSTIGTGVTKIACGAIFQGTTNECFTAGYIHSVNYSSGNANLYARLLIQGEDQAVHSGAITYKVRVGPSATGTVVVGPQALMGGVFQFGNANTFLVLEEIKV